MAMRLVSVNVSLGKTVQWKGQPLETGIFKMPVAGRARIGRLSLDGDRQADLRVHGGEYKAVYAYSAEHYAWWRGELGRDLPFGTFGENLTIEGLPEKDVCVGDSFRIGDAVLQAVQPRMPCYKLGIKFGDPGIVKKFLDSGRWGVYFRVLKEGSVAFGDEVTREQIDPVRFPIQEIAKLFYSSSRDPERVRALLGLEALPPEWRKEFGEPR
jgi:MOSC domain-containing protein YiiM